MQLFVVSVDSQRLELVGQVLLEVVLCLAVQPGPHNFDTTLTTAIFQVNLGLPIVSLIF